jgi:formate dehydrogenase major subunit
MGVRRDLGVSVGIAWLVGITQAMSLRSLFSAWPLIRQLGRDRLALAAAVRSRKSSNLRGRTKSADAIVKSICPYCAVGCGQLVFVSDGTITQIEGDPDSPISRGRLCPKGSATRQLVQTPAREYAVKYRRPYGTQWEDLPLERAMEMIADRTIEARRATWEDDVDGNAVNRTMGIASLGGATLDNEENYLMKKLYTGLGVVQVENQARI